MEKSGLRHCATEKVPKNALMSSLGRCSKSMYKRHWHLKFKPVIKILFIVNLSILGLTGCTDLNLDKAVMKAAVDSVIDASFNHSYNRGRLKYFVASTASELIDMGYKWTQKALRNWH